MFPLSSAASEKPSLGFLLMFRTGEKEEAPGARLARKKPHSSWGSFSFQALVPIATWTRPPLPTAMSQAGYSRPSARLPSPTAVMGGPNVIPPSEDFAYFG